MAKEVKKEEAEVKGKESAEKAKLRAHFEAYKLSNPVKYEQKKAAFEKTLASMQ